MTSPGSPGRDEEAREKILAKLREMKVCCLRYHGSNLSPSEWYPRIKRTSLLSYPFMLLGKLLVDDNLTACECQASIVIRPCLFQFCDF